MTDDYASTSSKSDSISNNYTYKDYLLYKEKIESLNKANSSVLFFNDSDIHAAIVVNELIRRAKENRENIDMFCGSFYLFREKFKERVDKEKEKLMGYYEEKSKSNNEFDPVGDLMQTLNEFFDAKLHLNVILEKEDAFEKIKKEQSTWNKFESRIEDKSLRFYQLDSNLRNIHDHFIVSGNSFRKEISESNRTALCSFNRPEYANMYKNTFKLMRNLSREC